MAEFCPNGCFFDGIESRLLSFRDTDLHKKVVRSYFHQLIDALSYMHSNDAAHLDIKPQNIMLDAKFNLKLIDFDFSAFGTKEKLPRGTSGFRAPEVIESYEYDPKPADIYSAGILLFTLYLGIPPFSEEGRGRFWARWFTSQRQAFWEKLAKCLNKTEDLIEESFKSLIGRMLDENPETRITVEQIKETQWYNGDKIKDTELE